MKQKLIQIKKVKKGKVINKKINSLKSKCSFNSSTNSFKKDFSSVNISILKIFLENFENLFTVLCK